MSPGENVAGPLRYCADDAAPVARILSSKPQLVATLLTASTTMTARNVHQPPLRAAWLASWVTTLIAVLAAPIAAGEAPHDVVIVNGMIYDGRGGPPYRGEVAIDGDRIAYAGAPRGLSGGRVIDAAGKAVAPGFINVLSWSNEALLADGLGQSALRQGVTLEVMGEGGSMGPLNEP